MAEKDESSADTSAEKAFAAASDAVASVTPVVEPETTEAAAVEPAPQPESPSVTDTVEVLAPEPVVSAPPAPKKAPAKPRVAAKPKAISAVAKKAPAKPKAVAKPKIAPKAKIPAPVKPVAAKAAPVAKPAESFVSKIPSVSQIKEKTMTKTTEFTEGFQKVMSESQDKAKVAFEKGKTLLEDAGAFTKGNVEAVVESGKVFASGLQSMGSDFVADSKAAMETMTADVKEFAAVKSPSDFVKLQSDVMRRNLDTAIAKGSKNSEAMLKLASDTFAPISARFSIVIDKFKKAA